jgi:hypothetical protein
MVTPYGRNAIWSQWHCISLYAKLESHVEPAATKFVTYAKLVLYIEPVAPALCAEFMSCAE